MVATIKNPQKGKRHQVVGFVAACVPSLKVDTDGALGVELKVFDYLATKVQKWIANKKEDEELEKMVKGLVVQNGGKKKKETKVAGKVQDKPKGDDKKEVPQPATDKQSPKSLSGNGGVPDLIVTKKEDPKSDNVQKKEGKNAISNGEKKDKKEITKPADEGKPKTENEEDKHSRATHDKQLDASLDDTVQAFKPDTTWDMVAGLENAKLQLQLAAELPEKQPALFQGRRKAAQFVLLYGPPGTGKGHLAKALCNGVDSTFFMVSASDMTSKWLGDSERLVRLLFKRARKNTPSIIFFDEIDALCGSREAEADALLAQMKTEFLVQMDGMNNDNSGVTVIAATNLPWKLDPAFIRRFQKRIEINLPDESSREKVFQIEIGETQCNLTAEDYKELGRKSAGFSGSDIKSTVQHALNCPLAKIIHATHFFIDDDGHYIPCDSTHEGALMMSWREVPRNMIKDVGMGRDDIFESLRQSRSSVNPKDLEKYSEWTEMHGTSGA
ncbi:AAA-domain-containing protein [Microthyrium microscopicum]|uniref:AAA-domain-containing protein n=1 Tax=Microthyrium microscopicum TaxID=703497 RepID=A0A6A6UA19_9PEZI|nr:AAA-domain-containing protein [Microthyrium microscopicum]